MARLTATKHAICGRVPDLAACGALTLSDTASQTIGLPLDAAVRQALVPFRLLVLLGLASRVPGRVYESFVTGKQTHRQGVTRGGLPRRGCA